MSTALSASRERAVLLVLAAVQFVHVLDFMIMMPLGPELMSRFSIGPAGFARLVAAYGLSAGVTGLAAAFFLDRFGRKRALLVLFSGVVLATVACALARSYEALLVARLLAGGFGGVCGSIVTATVGDVVPRERRGAGMAFVMSAFSIGQILGVPAGLALASAFGWNAAFFGLAGAGVLTLLAAVWVLPPVTAHLEGGETGSSLTRMRAIVGDPNHLRAIALVAMLSVSGMIVVPFLPGAVVRNGGLSAGGLSLVYVLGGVSTIIGNNLLGHLGDRFGHVRVFNLIALGAILPVLAVGFVGPWPAAMVLAATTLFIMSLGGRWTPSMAIVTMSVHARHRGGFMSLNAAVQAVSGALAAWLAGGIVKEGADGRLLNFHWAAGASLVFLGAAVLLIRGIRVVDEAATPRPPDATSGVTD